MPDSDAQCVFLFIDRREELTVIISKKNCEQILFVVKKIVISV